MSGLQAQNLEQYIPKDSKAVVEINGDQIFSLIDFTDLESLLPPDPSGAPMDLEQYGINIKSKAYYFYQTKDAIGYQNFVVGLSDATKAEEFITSMLASEPKTVSGFKFVMDDGMTAAWNNNTAILTYVDFPKKVYTMDELIEEKAAERRANESSIEEDVPDDEYGAEENLGIELMLKNMDAPSLLSLIHI